MRLGVLYSGGKDSCLALHMASERDTVAGLVTMRSRNPESYMFHTPDVHLARLHAESMGLPIIERETAGVKEEELSDLDAAVAQARRDWGIGGVVTGAVASRYQADRVRRICDGLGLASVNPLWGVDQLWLLGELLRLRFEVMVVGVFAPPLDGSWLGRVLDRAMVGELAHLQRSHGINPAGEGGELETTVLWAPRFSRRVEVVRAAKREGPTSAVLAIEEARLSDA